MAKVIRHAITNRRWEPGLIFEFSKGVGVAR